MYVRLLIQGRESLLTRVLRGGRSKGMASMREGAAWHRQGRRKTRHSMRFGTAQDTAQLCLAQLQLCLVSQSFTNFTVVLTPRMLHRDEFSGRPMQHPL